MKISKAEVRVLVKHFKKLVEQDIVGITSSDARNVVGDWLMEIGQQQASRDFEKAIYDYQISPKMRKMEEEYNKQ